MLKRLLEKIATTTEKHLAVYLRLAARRGPEMNTIISLLLDHFQGIAPSRRIFIQRLLFKAIRTATIRNNFNGPIDIESVRNDVRLVFHAVLQWMASGLEVPGSAALMEECFNRLNDSCGHFQTRPGSLLFLNQPVSNNSNAGLQPWLNPVPAFMTGRYYVHMSQRELVRARPTCNRQQYACPCEGYHYDCKCHEASICYCYMILRGFQRPYIPLFASSRQLFEAACRGLVYWVDWLLWAGADPTNTPSTESLLAWAKRGRVHNQVAQLLVHHGWDLQKLAVTSAVPTSAKHHVVSEQITEAEHDMVEVWAAGSEKWCLFMFQNGSKFWHEKE